MDYNSTGAMRSPFSPRMRPSISGRRAMGSAKKTPQGLLQEEEVGDVIYKTPLLTVETYGAPLPVMVTEALTFGSGSVSARLSANGWCWVVCGRRVMAWQRDEAGAAARDLTLPQTDLAHKADLVELFVEGGAQIPSCVGVSPEGVVRYWPSVAQEGVYVDVSCELAGQECERLCASASAASGATLVLATTTCTLVLLSPADKDGRATVTCKTLRPPSGWLGGIGRRVSLLFFGSMTVHADTRLVGVVWWGADSVALVGDGGGAGPMLQLWSHHGTTQHALRPLLAAAAAGAAPHLAHPDPTSLEVQALDLHATDNDGLLLLVAIVNVARSPEVRYAIAYISLADPAEPSVRSVTSVRAPNVTDGDPPRLVAVDSRHVIVYTSTALLYAAEGEGVVQLAAGDRVVTFGRCFEGALALLARHGVVRVRCSAAPRAPPPAPTDLALHGLDPHALQPTATSATQRLQTAFLFHLRRDTAAARALLPHPVQSDECDDVDAPLDRSVLAVASDMLDDMPAGDPRWKSRSGSSSISLGSSSALQILLQLQDKKRAFSLFLDFLRAVQLWQQMQNVTFEGTVVRTRWALCALAERLAAAIALRTLQHQADNPLIDAAIYQMVQEDEEEGLESAESGGQLPPADIWYRRVTRVHRILAVLPPQDTNTHTALQAFAVLNHVLAEMASCRAQWAGAGGGGAGPAPAWLRPLQGWLRRALSAAGSERADTERTALHEAAHTLADLLLAAAATHLPRPHLDDFTRDTLRPFLEAGQRERAAVLAEKYGDYELLVEMCLDDDDWDRLEHYMDKYAEKGFPERAFALAADRGARAARRLVCCGSREASGRLERWLAAAGEERAALRAARQLARGERAHAADTLLAMAQGERQWVGRARTCAALGKLCALAAGAPDARGADATLALCEQQEALPAALRPRAPAAPLRPADLVRLYLEYEGADLTEYDYKKAIDLTHYIADEEERDRLRLQVWRAALLCDTWDECASDVDAHAVLQDKMFYRLVDLINIMGEDAARLVPPLAVLEELAPSDAAATYWLRTAYTLLALHD